MFSDTPPRRLLQAVAFLAASFTGTLSYSAEIAVSVLDVDGNPVPGVAVYARPDAAEPLPAPTETVVMDQIDRRFVPHLLVVQTGTTVDFPNSDSVAHHVYSFSKPNNFVLPLYKSDLRPQVTFAHSGVVTLGCNVHDDMLAYILVVDSRVYGLTDDDGVARLSIDNPEGVIVNIWSPRIRTEKEDLMRAVSAGKSAELTFSLTEKLHAPHEDATGALVWKRY